MRRSPPPSPGAARAAACSRLSIALTSTSHPPITHPLAASLCPASGAPASPTSGGPRRRSATGSHEAAASYARLAEARAKRAADADRRATARAAGTPVTDPDYYNPVWPITAAYEYVGHAALDPGAFAIVAASGSDPFLDRAFARYMGLILYHPEGVSPAPGGAPVLATLFVNVSDRGVRQIVQGTDESYT